jgi:hypothetical protein
MQHGQSELPAPVLFARTPAEKQFLAVEDGKWVILHYWVVKKKWHSRLKIPCQRKTVQFYEPLGEWLYRILELCIQCHAVHQLGANYPNAASWFSSIVIEAKMSVLGGFIARSTDGKEGCIQEYKDGASKLSGTLRRGENPYFLEVEPHIYRLVEAALELADEPDISFLRDYWRPFLKSITLLVAHRKQGGRITLVEHKRKLYSQGGKGRGKTLFF